MKKIISTQDAPGAIGPYSQAVMVNGMLFTSGQIAINPESGELVLTDIPAETRQVIVKTSIFLSSMDDFSTVNEIYASCFSSDFPARETVQVAKLPKGVNVEISMIAVKP